MLLSINNVHVKINTVQKKVIECKLLCCFDIALLLANQNCHVYYYSLVYSTTGCVTRHLDFDFFDGLAEVPRD